MKKKKFQLKILKKKFIFLEKNRFFKLLYNLKFYKFMSFTLVYLSS